MQVDGETPTQLYMIGRGNEFAQMLGIGPFTIRFVEPPVQTWAGWAACPQPERPPWIVNIHKDWIESEIAQTRGRSYMDELLAHEMCHVYLGHTRHCDGAYNEEAANQCGHNLVIGSK